ncbi:hypothetical protein Tco_1536059 [Tanacetum coccineum]
MKKFDFANVKTASTPIETQKPLVKDAEASDVDVHLYRSIIGSLMYLTASRPDIMFAVCACSRFQVTPKSSHLSLVKRIFRYLKGKPKLGLWYPRVYSFDLESYSDSYYAGANLDRKSTTEGEDAIISPMDREYMLVSRDPKSKSTPSRLRTKHVCFQKATSRSESHNWPTENRFIEIFMNEIGEIRAISGHVLGNNLDNLQSIREEED